MPSSESTPLLQIPSQVNQAVSNFMTSRTVARAQGGMYTHYSRMIVSDNVFPFLTGDDDDLVIVDAVPIYFFVFFYF